MLDFEPKRRDFLLKVSPLAAALIQVACSSGRVPTPAEKALKQQIEILEDRGFLRTHRLVDPKKEPFPPGARLLTPHILAVGDHYRFVYELQRSDKETQTHPISIKWEKVYFKTSEEDKDAWINFDIHAWEVVSKSGGFRAYNPESDRELAKRLVVKKADVILPVREYEKILPEVRKHLSRRTV